MTHVRQALALLLAAIVVVACSDSKKEPTTETAAPPPEQPAPAKPANQTDQTEAAAGEPESDVAVTVREESYETFVDVHLAGGERPALDYRSKSEHLFLKWDGSRPQKDQVDDVSRMLERLYARQEAPTDPKTLGVGLYYSAYPDYVERLARHAGQDPAWTKIRLAELPIGEPRIKALHDYIEQTTRRERLHPELDAIFEAVGRRVELEDVEKCSTAKPGGKGELGTFLKERGVPGKVKLPAGCLMSTFRVEAK